MSLCQQTVYQQLHAETLFLLLYLGQQSCSCSPHVRLGSSLLGSSSSRKWGISLLSVWSWSITFPSGCERVAVFDAKIAFMQRWRKQKTVHQFPESLSARNENTMWRKQKCLSHQVKHACRDSPHKLMTACHQDESSWHFRSRCWKSPSALQPSPSERNKNHRSCEWIKDYVCSSSVLTTQLCSSGPLV